MSVLLDQLTTALIDALQVDPVAAPARGGACQAVVAAVSAAWPIDWVDGATFGQYLARRLAEIAVARRGG